MEEYMLEDIKIMYEHFIADEKDEKSENQKSIEIKFHESIDEYIKWHKTLKYRLFSSEITPAKRQETMALLFASETNIDHLYYMTNIFNAKQLKPNLPVLIFNYIANYTETNMKSLYTIKERTYKSDPLIFLQNFVGKAQIPRYLKMTTSSKKSMSNLCTEELNKKIKYAFIHIVSFLKILNLPICEKSHKIKCLKWYFENFEENTDLFFYFGEICRDTKELESYIEYGNKSQKDGDYLRIIQELNKITKSIEKIDDLNLEDRYSNKITQYILEKKNHEIEKTIEERNNKFFYQPDTFSKRFDYYYGKYLHKLMHCTKRQFDLFKIFIDTSDIFAKKLMVYCKQPKGELLFSLDDVKFAINSIDDMKKTDRLEACRAPYPFFVITYNNITNSSDYIYECENSIYLNGCISEINGIFYFGKKIEKCRLSNLDCQNDYYIIINEFGYRQSELLSYINEKNNFLPKWVKPILVYYIVYGGMNESFKNFDWLGQ